MTKSGAASTMLSTLQAEFDNADFTARDIIAVFDAGASSLGVLDTTMRERADQLLDAFGQLLGRRLDRPTAGTIGKILNNRLVDRPTFIDDSDVAVVLKASWEKHTSRYRVQLLSTDGANYSTASSVSAEIFSPISPISPLLAAAQGTEGDGGDGGHSSSQSPLVKQVISRAGARASPAPKDGETEGEL